MPVSPTRTTITFAVLASVAIASGSLALAAATSRDSVPERIYVTDVGGRVEVSTNGIAYEVEVDSTIALPSRILTGSDGTLGIKQAETSISVAPDSEIEIPEAAADGQLIARIVQHRGNVFYDVAKREVGRFRVETPYLVAVVKGTQFNVAVGADNTMISLFEGSLEILTPDETDLIQLDAGEIAVRSREDIQIRVLGMDDAGPQAGLPALDDGRAARTDRDTSESVVVVPGASSVTAADVARQGSVDARPVSSDSGHAPAAEHGAVGVVGDAGAEVSLGPGNSDFGQSVAAEHGPVSVESNVDLGSAPLAAGGTVVVGIDTGPVDIDLDLDVGLDVELDAELDLGGDAEIDAGEDTVDVGETVEELLDPLPDTLSVPGLLNGSR